MAAAVGKELAKYALAELGSYAVKKAKKHGPGLAKKAGKYALRKALKAVSSKVNNKGTQSSSTKPKPAIVKEPHYSKIHKAEVRMVKNKMAGGSSHEKETLPAGYSPIEYIPSKKANYAISSAGYSQRKLMKAPMALTYSPEASTKTRQ